MHNVRNVNGRRCAGRRIVVQGLVLRWCCFVNVVFANSLVGIRDLVVVWFTVVVSCLSGGYP